MSGKEPTLTEVFDVLLTDGLGTLEVVRDDDTTIAFDSSTLVNSLIESEVPLRDSFIILDRFKELSSRRFTDGRLTFRDIHALVGELLLEYDQHPDHTLWFANYENLYYPEIAAWPVEDGFIYARQSGQLQQVVTSLLSSEEFGFSAVPRRDVEAATERIVRLVRMCGFYKLPTTFVHEFCRHIAHYSSKRILPAPKRELDHYVKRLRNAEQQISLARLQLSASPTDRQIHGLLEIATASIAETWLESYGFVRKPDPGASLKQMIEILGDGRSHHQRTDTSANRAFEAYAQVRASLSRYGISANRLLNACSELNQYLTRRITNAENEPQFPVNPGHCMNAADLAEDTLNLVRIAVGAESALGAVLALLQSQAASLTLLSAIAEHLRLGGIPSFSLPAAIRVGTSEPQRHHDLLQIEMGAIYTKARDYGNSLALCILPSGLDPTEEAAVVDGLIDHVTRSDGAIGVLVAPEERAKALNGLVTATASSDQAFVVVTDNIQLMRALAEGRGMFDFFGEALARRVVAPLVGASSQGAVPHIEKVSSVYDRGVLVDAWNALESRNPLQCTGVLHLLFEDLVRLSCRVAIAVINDRFGRDWESRLTTLRVPISDAYVKMASLNDVIGLLSTFRSEAERSADFAFLKHVVPSKKEIDILHKVRLERNKWSHVYRSASEATAFFHIVAEAAAVLSPSSRAWALVAVTQFADGEYHLVSSNGSVSPVEELEPRPAQPPRGSTAVGILLTTKAGRKFLPLVAYCDDNRCEAETAVVMTDRGDKMYCSKNHIISAGPRLAHLRRTVLTERGQPTPPPPTATSKPTDAVARVFVSYAHRDSKYLEADSLLGFVRALEKEDVQFWYDERIATGERWDETIRQQILQADIALVLISQSFLNSRYCQEVEIVNFLRERSSRGMRIYPIIVSPCDWRTHDWLAGTQFQPRGGKTVEGNYRGRAPRDKFYLEVLQELRAIVQEVRDDKASGGKL